MRKYGQFCTNWPVVPDGFDSLHPLQLVGFSYLRINATSGRDLFDLYWALTKAKPRIDPAAVIQSFQHYLRHEGNTAGRTEFKERLEAHLADGGFCSDVEPLLRAGQVYDPKQAGDYVKRRLLKLLPDSKQ